MKKKKPDYSSFFYFNPLPSWVYDKETFKILDVNQAAINHYGYTKQEFLDLTIKDLRLEEEIPKLVELHKEIEKREGTNYFGVFTHQKKNGELIRMEINGLEVEHLLIECMMIVGQDVTEEEKQQLKLLKSVVTNINDAVLITEAGPIDDHGPKIIYVNEAFTNMTGYAAEEIIGKTPLIFQGQKSDSAQLKKLKKALQKREYCKITTVNYKKNGDQFWIDLSISPVKKDEGLFTHWVFIERDVTKQKSREQEKELIGEISIIFNIENDYVRAANKVCKTISEFGEFGLVELWVTNLERSRIHLLTRYVMDTVNEQLFQRGNGGNSFQISEGLPGTVWAKNDQVLWDHIDRHDYLTQKVIAQETGLKSVIGIPMFFSDEVVGVLVIGTTQASGYLEKFNKIFQQLGSLIGTVINHRKLESDLGYLYEAIPDILCLADFQGRFLKMNNAGCELLGYSKDEILYRSIDEFVHPDDMDITTREVMKLSKGETVIEFENRYITKSGEIVWLSWTCNSKVEEGIISACARDITTEKKLQELNLMASELARIGSWEVDLKNEKIYWSDMVHEIHETDPKTFSPDLETTINFCREDFRPMVNEKVNKCVNEGTPFYFEAVLVTAENNERWIQTIGRAEMINGECSRIYGSIQDIHASKSMELQVHEILGSISDAFFALNSNWEFTYFNKESENLLQKKESDVIGKNMWQVFPEVNGSPLKEIYYRVAETQKQESFEYLFPGDGRWYEVSVYPLEGGISVYFSDIDEVMQALENLKIADQEKNNILESIDDAFFRVNADWIITYWNRAAEVTIGIKREKLIDKNLWDIFPDAATLPSYTNYHQAMATGEAVNFEEYNPAFDKWFEVSVYPSKDGLTVYFRDITHRKETDRRLLRSLEEKNNILESISDSFFSVDKNWIITYWNKANEKLSGKDRDVMIGKNLWEEYADAIDSKFYSHYHKAMETGEAVFFEEYYSDLDIWVESSVYPSENGLAVFSKDITDKKKADMRLLEANERFEKVCEATNDAIWDWNLLENTHYWGSGFEKNFGYTVDENETPIKDWTKNIHPDDRDQVFQSIQEAIDKPNQSKWRADYRFRKNDGTYANVIDRGVVIRDDTGKATRMVGAVIDITERKKHENQLLELNKALEQHGYHLEVNNEKLKEVAWTQSHVVRAPLARMLSIIDVIEDHDDNLDDILAWLKPLKDSANELDEIVKRIVKEAQQLKN